MAGKPTDRRCESDRKDRIESDVSDYTKQFKIFESSSKQAEIENSNAKYSMHTEETMTTRELYKVSKTNQADLVVQQKKHGFSEQHLKCDSL